MQMNGLPAHGTIHYSTQRKDVADIPSKKPLKIKFKLTYKSGTIE
jgi:hypothetical protein